MPAPLKDQTSLIKFVLSFLPKWTYLLSTWHRSFGVSTGTMLNKTVYPQLFLRLAIGIGFLVPGLDRLGVWGSNGQKNISWGDWNHFSAYAHETMGFLPGNVAEFFAILATFAELLFGFLLIIGLFTRSAALGSGLLTLCFALSMTVSFGIVSPLSYSVFTVSAASFLLATIPMYQWSIDQNRIKKAN